MKRLIVGVTGASGSIYAIDLLKKLQQIPTVEVHLVLSMWAQKNIAIETDYKLSDIQKLAEFNYKAQDLGAAIASGSFLTDGMFVVPASMKTVAGIASGYSDDLIMRAADVTLKEQRKLVLVPRETPLSPIHLENLTKLARLGVQIIPPIPAFYGGPTTIQDLLDHQSMKLLDAFQIENNFRKRWSGD
ncbi:3-octaprenyl-4-hydroxybenzoate carboxy-lyase [Liquorilactobacillus mali KCTC 3596 = DSM 20444]|uniref:UbiX family flavin prenyltransferase n=1 Tax=Liquorilactobacillus mali TaxID=1618 RepID=UPI00026BF010|nr:UbiX family flavin prenyltransferase [Liquorilactobacillus mali]EJE99124.1 3-octaprenyl-4-hydroxybenzoate carboxy-lyase [Liquorilactobacillus mali KCTC 3596 = DSM 20444]